MEDLRFYGGIALAVIIFAILFYILFWRRSQHEEVPQEEDVVPSKDDPQLTKVQLHPGIYLLLVGLTALAYGALLLVGILYWDLDMGAAGIELNLGPGLLLIPLVHFGKSIRMVEADDIAALYFYGKALKKAESGLQFVPFGLVQLVKFSRLMYEFQFPDEPENVFKGDDKEPLPPGMVRPIRVVTCAPEGDAKGVLDVQMTLVLNFIVQFKIVNVFNFIANIGSIEKAKQQLRDIGETTLAEEGSTRTTSKVFREQAEINRELRSKIEERTSNWGAKIMSSRMISPDPSHTVSEALAAIPTAKATAERIRITAAAERDRLTEEGVGVAKAREAFLTAEAEGEKKMKTALGVSGQDVLAAKVTKAGFEKATTTLVVGAEGGMRDMVGAAQAVKKMFSPTTEGTTP